MDRWMFKQRGTHVRIEHQVVKILFHLLKPLVERGSKLLGRFVCIKNCFQDWWGSEPWGRCLRFLFHLSFIHHGS